MGPEKCLFGKPAIRRGRERLWSVGGEVCDVVGDVRDPGGEYLPFGAKWRSPANANRPSPNREWIDRDSGWLENFETIYVAMDMDAPGRRAAMDIINEIGPRRCRLVSLPDGMKDANDL